MSILRYRLPDLDRFDFVVVGLLFLLTLGTAGLVWRGDRVGARVVGLQPSNGAESVSSRTSIRITFADPMEHTEVESRFHIVPPVEGRLDWADNTLLFRPAAPLTYGRTYTVTLLAGARSQGGRQVLKHVNWTFHVGHPGVVYMALDEEAYLQLFLAGPEGSPALQLTRSPQEVWDYAVHPEGKAIAYSVLLEDGGADLWLMDRDGGSPRLLLACPNASCTAPAWSADGRQVAYERRETVSPTIGFGSGPLTSWIWLLDPTTGETIPLFEDNQAQGHSPLWSPAGQRLAFYSPTETAVRIYDFTTGEQYFFDTLSGIGSWAPQGEEMVIPDVTYRDERPTDYIARVHLTGGRTLDISAPTATTDDASPHWSPTGEWIAIGRFSLPDGTRTLGQQLWLLRPDGSEAYPLVTDAEANFGAFAWRPDGGALAYVRTSLRDLAEPHPEVWVISVPSGSPQRLAADAVMPDWLP